MLPFDGNTMRAGEFKRQLMERLYPDSPDNAANSNFTIELLDAKTNAPLNTDEIVRNSMVLVKRVPLPNANSYNRGRGGGYNAPTSNGGGISHVAVGGGGGGNNINKSSVLNTNNNSGGGGGATNVNIEDEFGGDVFRAPASASSSSSFGERQGNNNNEEDNNVAEDDDDEETKKIGLIVNDAFSLVNPSVKHAASKNRFNPLPVGPKIPPRQHDASASSSSSSSSSASHANHYQSSSAGNANKASSTTTSTGTSGLFLGAQSEMNWGGNKPRGGAYFNKQQHQAMMTASGKSDDPIAKLQAQRKLHRMTHPGVPRTFLRDGVASTSSSASGAASSIAGGEAGGGWGR